MHTPETDCRILLDFLQAHERLVVLSGAGISVDSGIPSYRDVHGTWLHSKPIQAKDFLEQPASRQRYWARSWYGWPLMRDARPNSAHHALAELERRGQLALLITQNVDRLHQRAGSQRVVDLHGRLDQVRCLRCEKLLSRDAVQTQLAADNHWPATVPTLSKPDGDMDIDDALCGQVTPPRCPECSGNLMPNVVFFGGNIPAQRIKASNEALASADALIVVGSSLTVYSGFRFCRLAKRLDKPLLIINPGTTRADELADIHLRCAAAPLLTHVTERLSRG